MSRCPSCGGIIGRECFNPVECASISEVLASQHDQDHYKNGYDYGYHEGYQVGMSESQQPENSELVPKDLYSALGNLVEAHAEFYQEMKETDNDPDNDEWAEAVAMFAKYEHAQKADNQDILDFIKTVGAGQDCETAKMFVARITRQARELCSKHNQAI